MFPSGQQVVCPRFEFLLDGSTPLKRVGLIIGIYPARRYKIHFLRTLCRLATNSPARKPPDVQSLRESDRRAGQGR